MSTASQDLPRASRVKSTSGLLDRTAPAALTTTAPARALPCPVQAGAVPWTTLNYARGSSHDTARSNCRRASLSVERHHQAHSSGPDNTHAQNSAVLKIARCGDADMTLVAFETGNGGGHRIASKLESAPTLLPFAIPPCSSLQFRKMLPAPGLGKHSFKPLSLLRNFTGHGSVLPAIC
jgi:hypothetical protein